MNALEKKVFTYIDKHQMLLPGERVVAGISGGADSVCLLFVLLEWKKLYGLEPIVVHVNHGIRKEALEDARFVQDLCREYDLPFYLKEADIPVLARQQGCSEEEAGRNFRYQVFDEVAQELGATRIAVAHNANDLSETMLFHLFRGTGMKGLSGIPPVRDRIIRPLLCVEREEIEQYLREKDRDFCHDATNDGDDYTRNRIRHHILAYAKQEISTSCVQHMAQTADILAEAEDYLKQETEKALDQCICGQSEFTVELSCEIFQTFHPAIQKRLTLAAMEMVAPGVRDISHVHVDMVLGLFTQRSYRQFCLPCNIRAKREYDKVVVSRLPGVSEQQDPLGGLKLELEVISVDNLPKNEENLLIFPQNQYTKWFDYDKIERPPVIRTREIGDYLMIRDGEGQLRHKKLKDYMISEKIPKSKRDFCPLLAADSHVMWVIGHRISEYYKVCENTKRILQVQLILDKEQTEDEDGRTY